MNPTLKLNLSNHRPSYTKENKLRVDNKKIVPLPLNTRRGWERIITGLLIIELFFLLLN